MVKNLLGRNCRILVSLILDTMVTLVYEKIGSQNWLFFLRNRLIMTPVSHFAHSHRNCNFKNEIHFVKKMLFSFKIVTLCRNQLPCIADFDHLRFQPVQYNSRIIPTLVTIRIVLEMYRYISSHYYCELSVMIYNIHTPTNLIYDYPQGQKGLNILKCTNKRYYANFLHAFQLKRKSRKINLVSRTLRNGSMKNFNLCPKKAYVLYI